MSTKDAKEAFFVSGAVGVILLVLFILVVSPFVIIWGLNTLFPLLAIPYTFWTWLAVCVLNTTVNSSFNLGNMFKSN